MFIRCLYTSDAFQIKWSLTDILQKYMWYLGIFINEKNSSCIEELYARIVCYILAHLNYNKLHLINMQIWWVYLV